jgi:hypothetical protein
MQAFVDGMSGNASVPASGVYLAVDFFVNELITILD